MKGQKNFATETERIFKQGELTPDVWLKKATGNAIDLKIIEESAEKALNKLNNSN